MSKIQGTLNYDQLRRQHHVPKHARWFSVNGQYFSRDGKPPNTVTGGRTTYGNSFCQVPGNGFTSVGGNHHHGGHYQHNLAHRHCHSNHFNGGLSNINLGNSANVSSTPGCGQSPVFLSDGVSANAFASAGAGNAFASASASSSGGNAFASASASAGGLLLI